MTVGKGLEMFQKKEKADSDDKRGKVAEMDLSLYGRDIDQDIDDGVKKDSKGGSDNELNVSEVRAVNIEETFPNSIEDIKMEQEMEEELESKAIQSFAESQYNINKLESPKSKKKIDKMFSSNLVNDKKSSKSKGRKMSADLPSKKIEEEEEKPRPPKLNIAPDGAQEEKEEGDKTKEANPWGEAFEQSEPTLDFGKGFSPNNDLVEADPEVKPEFWESNISPIEKKARFFKKKKEEKEKEKDFSERRKSFRKRRQGSFVVVASKIEEEKEEEKVKETLDIAKSIRSRSRSRAGSIKKKKKVGASIKIVSKKLDIKAITVTEPKTTTAKEEKEPEEIKINLKDQGKEKEPTIDDDQLSDWNPPGIGDFNLGRETPCFDKFIPNSMESIGAFPRPDDFDGLKFTKNKNVDQMPSIDLNSDADTPAGSNKRVVKTDQNSPSILGEKMQRVLDKQEKDKIEKKRPLVKLPTFQQTSGKKEREQKEGIQAIGQEEIEEVSNAGVELTIKEDQTDKEKVQIPADDAEPVKKFDTADELKLEENKNPFLNFQKNEEKSEEQKLEDISISVDNFGKIETSVDLSSNDFGNFADFGSQQDKAEEEIMPMNKSKAKADTPRGAFGKKSKDNVVKSKEKKMDKFEQKEVCDDEEEEKEFESAIDDIESDIETNFDQKKFKEEDKEDSNGFKKQLENSKHDDKTEAKDPEIIKEEEKDTVQGLPEKIPLSKKSSKKEKEETKSNQNDAKLIHSSTGELPSESTLKQDSSPIKKTNFAKLALKKTTSIASEINKNNLSALKKADLEDQSPDLFKEFDFKVNNESDWNDNWAVEEAVNDSWNDQSQSILLEPLQISGNLEVNDSDPFADV